MLERLRAYFKGSYIRYLLSYLLLMALLVGGLTLYMYTYYRKSAYQTTVSAETSLTYQLKYSCDGYLSALDALGRQTAAMYGGREAEIAQALSLFPLSTGRETVFLYLEKSKRLYGTDGSFAEASFDEAISYDDIAPERARLLLMKPEGLTVLPEQGLRLKGEEAQLMTLALPLEGEGSLICLLPESALFVLGGSGSPCNRYMLLGQQICARSEEFSLDESYVLRSGAFITDLYTNVRRTGGREYQFIAVPGDEEGVVYVSALTLNGIYARAAGMWLGFMAVLMLLALPVTGFMLWISRRNYAHIREMGRRFGSGQQNADDISLIARGISELEGRARRMEQTSREAGRRAFARELLGGAYADTQSAQRAAQALGMELKGNLCAVLLCGAPQSGQPEKLLDSLLEAGDDSVSLCGAWLMENAQILILCFAFDAQAIRLLAARMSERCGEMPLALSAVHEADVSELPRAYQEALGAYEGRFFSGSGQLLSFGEVTQPGKSALLPAQDFAADLKRALDEEDKALLKRTLTALEAAMRSSDIDLFSFRRIYSDMSAVIMSRAAALGLPAPELYERLSLSNLSGGKELVKTLEEVCEKIMGAGETVSPAPVGSLTRIMTENYTDPEFTLTRAALMAGISPARLTLEFKSAMGMTPTDYLTMLRMEHAKKLLRQTQLPIGDVCVQSGYADASSFTRRFKQYEGVTPMQYRQKE